MSLTKFNIFFNLQKITSLLMYVLSLNMLILDHIFSNIMDEYITLVVIIFQKISF